MCGSPSVFGLLTAVQSGVQWSARPIFFGLSLAWTLVSQPYSQFEYLVASAGLAFTAPTAFGVPPTLTSLEAFAASATLATCPTLTACPIQFLLPIHVLPGSGTSLFTVFMCCISGMFPDGGAFRVGLWRGPGPFALFPIKWGGLLLLEMLLALAVQVPN